jgi:hypothetical protein
MIGGVEGKIVNRVGCVVVVVVVASLLSIDND